MVIVRIATEGQYRVSDDQLPRLQELDDAHLGPSDAILPPPDVSLAEATRELNTEGLIPS